MRDEPLNYHRTPNSPLMGARKKAMQTIELPVTWQGTLPIILLVLTDGDAEGRKLAREELTRMAQLADLYAAQQKEVTA